MDSSNESAAITKEKRRSPSAAEPVETDRQQQKERYADIRAVLGGVRDQAD